MTLTWLILNITATSNNTKLNNRPRKLLPYAQAKARAWFRVFYTIGLGTVLSRMKHILLLQAPLLLSTCTHHVTHWWVTGQQSENEENDICYYIIKLVTLSKMCDCKQRSNQHTSETKTMQRKKNMLCMQLYRKAWNAEVFFSGVNNNKVLYEV